MAQRLRLRESDPLQVRGTTTSINAINSARLGTDESRLLVVHLSQVWGGGWLHFAAVLEPRNRLCKGFAGHRVPHRQLLEAAVQDALGDVERLPTPLVFSPQCREVVTFPAWARASAVEASACERFSAALRESITGVDDDRGYRSHPEVIRAARAWIEGEYNPACRPQLEQVA
jgi:hypothetical protein